MTADMFYSVMRGEVRWYCTPRVETAIEELERLYRHPSGQPYRELGTGTLCFSDADKAYIHAMAKHYEPLWYDRHQSHAGTHPWLQYSPVPIGIGAGDLCIVHDFMNGDRGRDQYTVNVKAKMLDFGAHGGVRVRITQKVSSQFTCGEEIEVPIHVVKRRDQAL